MNKKLERTLNDRVLGGVCSGLGHYFSIDPAIVRLIFCIAFFVFGTGFLAYIILWIAIPAHNETTTVNGETDKSVSQTAVNNRNGNMALGITFIAVGAFLLLCNYLPEQSLKKLWPVAVIIIGIVMIINAFKKKES